MNKLPLTRKGRKLKKKAALIFTLVVAVFILLTAIAIMIDNFFDNYDLNFQSPVILQNPVQIDKRTTKIVSPLGIVQKVEAEEIKNPFEEESPKGIAWELNRERFGIEHWDALEDLITKESGWNPFSVNRSSGACGLGQALPCSKMACENWDYKCQVDWILNYIENRYETPKGALAHWMARKPINGKDVGNWY